MTFQSQNGTRGAKQPGGRMLKWFNARNAKRIATRGGTSMGGDALVLTTIGKQSGQPRETPVAWFPGPDGSRFVVASANGAAKNPAWYYNLAAHPDRVSYTVAGETVPVTARQLHGDERAAAWASIAAASPRFAEYETKTDRVLPVIRLDPR